MLGMVSTVSFVVGSFLIFSSNTYGLQKSDRQQIPNSRSDLFIKTIPNTSNTVNLDWIPKFSLDFTHVSADAALSGHVNMAAEQETSKSNRESSKQKFGLQGQVHGHNTKDKQRQLNRRIFSKKYGKTTMSELKENVILNGEMSDQQKLPGIMDRLWSALNYGSLTELHKKKTLASAAPSPPHPDADYWTVIKEKINRGVLFVEIGGCLTASSVAADWNSNSLVVSLLFKDLYNECISNARESGLRNFLIGTVTQVQQMVESLFFDKAVAIEHLFLSNLQVLWESLLPHECEDLLSKLLALSWKTYIVNPTVNIGHVSLYTRWWTNLGTFLNICCQKRNCRVDLLNGTNSWESPAIYQVIQKSGYRPIIDINKKQQQSFHLKPDKYLIEDTRDRLVSQLNNNYSFAVLAKGVSFSKESIQFLFLTCLQIPATLWNEMMHLPFITLKPFPLHIYWPDHLPSKIQIKTGTQKYTKAFKTHQTFKPDQTLNYDAVGEFWDREVVMNIPHKSANEREIAISNAFWDRDGSFLEHEVKKEDELPFWSDDIWNREELEESHRYNSGMFKSRNRFHKQTGNSLLHKSKGSFHLSKSRSFQDNNNLSGLVNGISATRQKYFTIQRQEFSKMSFFQFAQKPSLFLSKRKITLKQGKKLTVPTKVARVKESLYLSRKMAEIDENVPLDQSNMKQEIPFIKNKIVLNKINPKNSKIIQQKIPNDLRNSTWNLDRFKWTLPIYPSVRLDFTPPIPKMAKYISMKKTRFTGNKLKDQVRKAKFSSKTVWNQRKSKLGESRIRKEFYPDQSRDDPSKDNRLKIENNFHNLLKMEEIKISQENNKPQENEKKDDTDERIYQSHWDAVKFLFKQKLNGNFSLLVYGSKHLTLLAAKTGLLYPHSTVLNIVPKLDAAFADKYRDILPPNVLTAINDLDTQIINTISHLPNLFGFQILGVDIFAKILFLKEDFIEYLRNILSLAQVTIFTVPKLEQFILAQNIFGDMNGTKEENQDFSFKKLILKAAATIGEVNIEVIKDDDFGGSLLFVELKNLKKQVIVDCSHGKGHLIFESVSSVSTYIQTDNSVIFFDTRTIVISLLLALKLRATDKRQLFLCYLHLPIYKDMCPHLIFWSSHGLSHSDQQIEWKYKQFSPNSDSNLLARIFTKELMEPSAPFSFLEYQSDGSVISQLAKMFPNSTFIAVTQDHQTATSIYQREAIKNNLENLLVTQHTVNDNFTLKLLRSPEFFRYQFMGYKCFLNLASALSRKEFNLMMGQLLSIGASNFLILPSEKSISLGLLTFYPEFHLDQWSEMDHNSEKNVYLSSNHPSTFYKNAERKIIFESAQADVRAEVEAITSLHFHLGEGNLFPWRLLRVNIKNLTTQVEHHFESYLDGHTRTYIQRCTSLGNGHYEVHLQRQSDGLIIPYGNIHAITLISLLRMGLLAEIQKKLYYQFLKLPLYEDMAPWNIVFSAGQLEYIDFDTKNKTFDFLAPMAYQIMSMLMNYERTIRDFGKCKSQAKTQFGFGFISNCVASNFLGPCKDSLQPVPCGDNTCRSTFIECLQALAKAEETKQK